MVWRTRSTLGALQCIALLSHYKYYFLGRPRHVFPYRTFYGGIVQLQGCRVTGLSQISQIHLTGNHLIKLTLEAEDPIGE